MNILVNSKSLLKKGGVLTIKLSNHHNTIALDVLTLRKDSGTLLFSLLSTMKNPAKAFLNQFTTEEAVAGTSTVAPLPGIESVINIDSIDPIGASFDPSTPNTEVPTSITFNPDRSPRDKSIRDMVNKEDAFEKGYDSDGELGPFNNRIDKEGQQLFNEDDDDGVGFVAERAIDDERGVGAAGDMDDTEVGEEVHVPINLDTLNGMNLNQIKK
jgi:hypothetical protein